MKAHMWKKNLYSACCIIQHVRPPPSINPNLVPTWIWGSTHGQRGMQRWVGDTHGKADLHLFNSIMRHFSSHDHYLCLWLLAPIFIIFVYVPWLVVDSNGLIHKSKLYVASTPKKMQHKEEEEQQVASSSIMRWHLNDIHKKW
jgi:hypothetical protein